MPPETLRRDLSLAREAGVSEVWLFGVNGINQEYLSILREILPNARAHLAAEFGQRFCFAFLFVAALGFLGLGAQSQAADWGAMVKESVFAIPAGIAAPLYPAAAIALLTIGVNMVVDWLQTMHTLPRAEKA